MSALFEHCDPTDKWVKTPEELAKEAAEAVKPTEFVTSTEAPDSAKEPLIKTIQGRWF